jgi:hypothetical protein
MRTALLLALLAVPAFAQSEPAAPPADAPTQPAASAEPEKSGPSAADAGMRAARKERFEAHRSVGFVVEALMLGSLGLWIADDVTRYGANPGRSSFTIPTLALAATAEVGLIVNLLLALTAPPRKAGLGAPPLTIVHQILMYAAGAVNIAKFVLGVVLAGATKDNVDPGLLTVYRVTSIAAPALFATGFTLKLF